MPTPVVFIHGAFCGGWAFDAFRGPFVAAGFQTHAPDLPGRGLGRMNGHRGQPSVRDYAKAIISFCHDLPRPPVLVGHSLGGLVAQIVATRMPVAGLALIAPSAPWGVMPTTLDEHSAAFGLHLLGDFWRRPIAPEYSVARHATLDRLERAEAREVFARFVPESGRAVHETMQWWLDPSMASAAPVYRIAAPVLALAGGQDMINPASTVRRIANRFPAGQAAYLEFPQMSHWMIGEPEWPDVADAVLRWMGAQGLVPSLTAATKKATRPSRRKTVVPQTATTI